MVSVIPGNARSWQWLRSFVNGSVARHIPRRIIKLEPLEIRTLMNVDWGETNDEGCSCCGSPVCACGLPVFVSDPQLMDDVEAALEEPYGALHALSSIPVLNSNLGAAASLFLDFDGHVESQWGSYSNVNSPVFSTDSDFTTFSDAEHTAIRQIWQRVAEDYAPFDINVTTVLPASFANGAAMRVSIGGGGSWYGSAGGVAYRDSFTNSLVNTAYVFSDRLSKNARYIAEAASHEAGHSFGLAHQSAYDSNGTLTESYNPGNAAWAPIMGLSYYSSRTTFHNGSTNSATNYQDDMALIARAANGFGYRADDHGGTVNAATALTLNGASVSSFGIIEKMTDVDSFSFNTAGGTISLTVNVAALGANLNARIELRDVGGTLIASAAPTDSFGANIVHNVAAGSYRLFVASEGDYGNVGQYSVSGTIIVGNSSPTANTDSYSVVSGNALTVSAANGVLKNDADSDGPTSLTAHLVSGPASGSLTLNSNGSFVFTPSADFSGDVSFVYRAYDGNSYSANATVTVSVSSANSAPTSNADSYSVVSGNALTVSAANGVLKNDADSDGPTSLTAHLVSGPASGSLTLNSNGSFVFTPSADFSGDVTFVYRAYDGNSYSTNATVTVSVSRPNSAPTSNADSYSVVAGNALAVSAANGVLKNDADSDGPTSLTAHLVSGPSSGSLSLSANGSFVFTPSTDFSGDVTFVYRAYDGASYSTNTTVTVSVSRPNSAPTSDADSYSVVAGNALTVSAANGVLKNDADSDGPSSLTAHLVSGPASGSLTLNSNGSFVFTPSASYTGDVTFVYRAYDGASYSTNTTVTVSVSSANSAPTSNADSYSVVAGNTLTVSATNGVLKNDTDSDGPSSLTAHLVSGPASGSLTLNSNGSFVFTPSASYTGDVTFVYRAYDGNSYSANATVTVSVSSANSAPTSNADSYSVVAGNALTVSATNGVLKNDTDSDGPASLTAHLVSGPASGSLTLNSNGSFVFTPSASYTGNVTFVYRAYDGTSYSANATVTISVNSSNVGPSAGNDVATTIRKLSVVIHVLANDSDANGIKTTTVTIVSAPSHGSTLIGADGTVTYKPTGKYVGTDSFNYRVRDNQGMLSNIATVTVTVGEPPHGAAGRWVQTLYDTVLGRDPVFAEIDYWGNVMAQGNTAESIAYSFINSRERRAGIIDTYYLDYLGRHADEGGINFWINVWDQNRGPEVVRAGLIGSQEYYTAHGGTDTGAIQGLYFDILGRGAGTEEINYWLNVLGRTTLSRVAMGFVTSDEYRLGIIDSWYVDYLARSCDEGGGQFWLQQMKFGTPQANIQAQLLTSAEVWNNS